MARKGKKQDDMMSFLYFFHRYLKACSWFAMVPVHAGSRFWSSYKLEHFPIARVDWMVYIGDSLQAMWDVRCYSALNDFCESGVKPHKYPVVNIQLGCL